MTLGTIKEETDMAVLQKILSFIWGILLVVGKLLYLAAKLVLSLFLLVGQLVLVFFHAGGSDF
jgi:tryptophan-rich sensory protein